MCTKGILITGSAPILCHATLKSSIVTHINSLSQTVRWNFLLKIFLYNLSTGIGITLGAAEFPGTMSPLLKNLVANWVQQEDYSKYSTEGYKQALKKKVISK